MFTTLIVEDDFVNRRLIQDFVKDFGPSHIAVNGLEAVEAVRAALEAGQAYTLICMDINMREMDGQTALKEIRKVEEMAGVDLSAGAKVIMMTTLSDMGNVLEAFRNSADAYLVKPIDRKAFLDNLREFGLIP